MLEYMYNITCAETFNDVCLELVIGVKLDWSALIYERDVCNLSCNRSR